VVFAWYNGPVGTDSTLNQSASFVDRNVPSYPSRTAQPRLTGSSPHRKTSR
jgi:hypothetical protein